MFITARLLAVRVILAAAVLLGFATAPAAASEYRYSWDFDTIANALRTGSYGRTFTGGTFVQNCHTLTDCAVVSMYLTPVLPAGTINILGAFGPEPWTNTIDPATQRIQFDAAGNPVLLITENTQIHGAFTYGTNNWTATGQLASGGDFGFSISTVDPSASLPSTLQWTLNATVLGLNADGTQRSFGTSKDPYANITLATEFYEQVPEPGTLALAGVAIAVMLHTARKRRRQA
jgi:hypothetical protein